MKEATLSFIDQTERGDAFITIHGRDRTLTINSKLSRELNITQDNNSFLVTSKAIIADDSKDALQFTKKRDAFIASKSDLCKSLLIAAGKDVTDITYLKAQITQPVIEVRQVTKISGFQIQVRDRVEKIRNAKRISNSEFLALLKGSTATEGSISELLNDKRSFSNKWVHSLWASINTTFSSDHDIIRTTRQFQMLENIFNSCKVNQDFRLVLGNTGIGKSMNLKAIIEETPDCYYFKMDRKLSWFAFLRSFAQSLGMDDRDYGATNQYLLHEKIHKFLIGKSHQYIVIVFDEMERLGIENWIRLKDMKESWPNVGFIIASIPEMREKLAKKAKLDPETWSPRNPQTHISNDYTTLARRFKVHNIPGISPEDVIHFYQHRGVSDLDVLNFATSQVWNYHQADMLLKKAVKMGMELPEMTLDHYKLIQVY